MVWSRIGHVTEDPWKNHASVLTSARTLRHALEPPHLLLPPTEATTQNSPPNDTQTVSVEGAPKATALEGRCNTWGPQATGDPSQIY
eukprot:2860475-Amphidinium_carterae.1